MSYLYLWFHRVQKTPVLLTTLLVLECFYSSHSFAQSTSLQVPATGRSKLTISQQGQSQKSFTTGLRLESMEYVTAIPEQKELTRSQFATVRFEGEKNFAQADRVIFGVDAFLGSHFSRKSTQFGLNEFYLTQFVTKKSIHDEHLTVGRRLYDWSELDRHWNLGLWESRLYNDAIRTESQGLTGLFYYSRGDAGEVLFLTSPIFVPNQGPEIKEERGNLTADSRWYRTPSPQFELLGKVNKIDYKLDIPDRMKLASKSGAAIHLKIGPQKGPFLKGSAGYKPVNELLFERRNFKRVDSLEVDVTVRPQTTYHLIYSADLGYKDDNTHLSISYLDENPEPVKAENDWAIQKLGAIKAYGLHGSLLLDPANNRYLRSLWDSPTELAVDYLKVEGGGIVDVRADGSKDALLLFDQRLQYYNSIRGRIKTQLGRLFRRPLGLSLSYLYDFDQSGSLMQTELKYDVTKSWVLILGADFLGVDDEAKAKATSFLNQNRANDRYYAGMGYVF
jgi:hypothetical protein